MRGCTTEMMPIRGGIGGLLAVAQAQVGGDVLYESGLRTDLHDHQFGLAAGKELA